MNVKSITRQLARLARGDGHAWRYLPYQLWTTSLRLDLSWASAAQSGLPEQHCSWHSNSGGPDLEDVLKRLDVNPTDSVVDIGCGKAGAMLTLCRYFQRVDGVEISPELARIARNNLRRAHAVNAQVFCCDAAHFRDLDDYAYFYMYNPFPERTFRLVMDNINESLRRRPRRSTLIYKNPVFDLFVLSQGFQKIDETEQPDPDYPRFAIYRAVAPHSAQHSRPHLS
jgi:SAM-dependent methyltransferase